MRSRVTAKRLPTSSSVCLALFADAEPQPEDLLSFGDSVASARSTWVVKVLTQQRVVWRAGRLVL